MTLGRPLDVVTGLSELGVAGWAGYVLWTQNPWFTTVVVTAICETAARDIRRGIKPTEKGPR